MWAAGCGRKGGVHAQIPADGTRWPGDRFCPAAFRLGEPAHAGRRPRRGGRRHRGNAGRAVSPLAPPSSLAPSSSLASLWLAPPSSLAALRLASPSSLAPLRLASSPLAPSSSLGPLLLTRGLCGWPARNSAGCVHWAAVDRAERTS